VKKFLSLSSLATLAIVLGMVSWASAQTSPSTSAPDAAPSQQTPSQETPSTQQPPAPEMPPSQQQTPSAQTPSQNPPSQTPDATAPESGSKAGSQSNSDSATRSSASDASGAQTFSGTVVKQGDKYVLKDDTGKTYDIDHQTDVARFEGKRVRVQGTLDPNGKILVK
jgi:outer membrane biosynthesis protein TonB